MVESGTILFDMNSLLRQTSEKTKEEDHFDKDLKSEKFLDTLNFPIAKLVLSESVKDSTKGTYKIKGKLTIKNITKDIELVYILKKNKDIIEIQGIFPLVRTDYGIMTGSSSILNSFSGIILDDIVHISFVSSFKEFKNDIIEKK